MNSPRFVLPLSKIDDIKKSNIMRARFIPAIIAPIKVNQFFEEGGSFIFAGFRLLNNVKLGKC